MADLVPGAGGAEKPRVFLWEAAAAAVRVVGTADAPWFVAKDVCAMLEIQNVSQALDALDDDEKGVCNTYTLGGAQDLLTINESGLYALIFRSRKEQAKIFRKWVTSEVLPQIRKTGAYAVPAARPAPPREIRISHTYAMPEPAKGTEAMVISLIMEVLAATRVGSRESVIVSGHTIIDIARRDGAFAEWFGPHRNFQANARFFKNLERFFDQPLYRTFPGDTFGGNPWAYIYTIHPEGRDRHRRYVLSVVNRDLPRDKFAHIPSAQALAIVDAALGAGGEVKVS